MKRWHFLMLIPALVLVALAMPSSARATETSELSFKGRIVKAGFSASEGECVVGDVDVQAAEGTFDDASGAPDIFRKVRVSVVRFDICQGAILLDAEGIVPFDSQAFEADKELHSASLNTTARICGGEPGSCFNVSINLTWMGIRDITSEETQFRRTSPTCTTQMHSNHSDRPAVVSGSISSDIFSLNPAVSTFGELAVVRNERVVMRGENCVSEGGGGAFPI
jgi:hypothetical protein